MLMTMMEEELPEAEEYDNRSSFSLMEDLYCEDVEASVSSVRNCMLSPPVGPDKKLTEELFLATSEIVKVVDRVTRTLLINPC